MAENVVRKTVNSHVLIELRKSYDRAENIDPIMANHSDQTSSNTSTDDDKSETIQTELNNKKSSKEDAVEYPPPAQAALVMLALLLALFLTAIVRTNYQPTKSKSTPPSTSKIANRHRSTGPHNNRHYNPSSHRRVRLVRGHWVVRRGLPPHLLLFLPLSRSRLHFLLAEIRISVAYCRLRDRFGGLRFCSQLGRVHYWTCDTGCGCCGYDVWRHGVDDQCSSVGEETGVDGSRGSHDGGCECCWTIARRGSDDEC